MDQQVKAENIKVCQVCLSLYSVRGILRQKSSRTCNRHCYNAILQNRIGPNRGKKFSQETRHKQRGAKLGIVGEAHPLWQGGQHGERKRLMQQDEYKQWRKSIFERDSYTCQECQSVDKHLHADHIKTWKDYPALRYEISNGRTLCYECHYEITFGRLDREKAVLWGIPAKYRMKVGG